MSGLVWNPPVDAWRSLSAPEWPPDSSLPWSISPIMGRPAFTQSSTGVLYRGGDERELFSKGNGCMAVCRAVERLRAVASFQHLHSDSNGKATPFFTSRRLARFRVPNIPHEFYSGQNSPRQYNTDHGRRPTGEPALPISMPKIICSLHKGNFRDGVDLRLKLTQNLH